MDHEVQLKQTYGGNIENMNSNSAFYCYTIYEKSRNMFYSGSRGVEGRDTHDLLINYFTSSKLKDFKDRLKGFPDDFVIYVEYFISRKEATIAEAAYHKKYNVSKSHNFYNICNAGNSNYGNGSVLCKDSNGKIYRISSHEYAKGKHRHPCADRMLIRLKDNSHISIFKKDFDSKIHKTQFSDFVLAFDKEKNVNTRIPKELFESDPTRYQGITAGIVIGKDKNGNTIRTSREEFLRRDDIVGLTKGKMPVICLKTNKTIIIDKRDYNKEIHRHHNAGTVCVFNIETGENIKVSKNDYNTEIHSNLMVKYFPVWNDKIYTSKDIFRADYRINTGKNINEKLRIEYYPEIDNRIEILSKHDLIERLKNDKN